MTPLNHHRKAIQQVLASVGIAASVALSGCSAAFDTVTSATAPIQTTGDAHAGPVVGTVHGGQQPISGSTIQFWEVGTSGYGSAATALGTSVTTGTNGGFTFATNPASSCTAGGYAYVTASGGDPQISSGTQTGNGNTAIALMAALGPCNTTNLNGNTFIQMNEVTTVAAVFAMAQFGSFTASSTLVSGASAQTPVDTFGTSSTNLQGVANAMQIAQILASYGTGVSTAASGNPATTTPANVSVEYGQINTLANILALCVNSTGVSSTPCSPIITAATPSGGTAPTDTIQIALNFAKNPTIGTSAQGSLNNSAYNAITGTPPFLPYDSAAPNDWTIGMSISTGAYDSRWIAIDKYGNAWVTTSGTGIVEIDPGTGNTFTATSACTAACTTATPTTTAIKDSYEVAVDTANNAWFSDNNTGNMVEIAGSSAVGVEAPGLYTGAGGTADVVTNATTTAGSLEGIVVDGSNNIWGAVSNATVVGLFSGSYGTAHTGGAVTGSPFGMAVDMSNTSKFGNSTLSGGGSFIYTLNSAGCSAIVTEDNATTHVGGSLSMDFTTASTIGTTNYAAGAATPIDHLLDVACVGSSTNTGIQNNNYSGYSVPRVFMAVPYGVAFDNNNAMWVVNQYYTSTTDTSSGTPSLSKMAPQNYSAYTAFTPAAVSGTSTAPGIEFVSIPGSTGGMNTSYYLAMDGNSAAWVGNSAGAPLSAFTNAGVNISPSTGFVGGACSGCTNTVSTTTIPYVMRKYSGSRGVAVDGSGNVWESNTGATYVTVVIGVAAPTVTPLSVGINKGTLASKP